MKYITRNDKFFFLNFLNESSFSYRPKLKTYGFLKNSFYFFFSDLILALLFKHFFFPNLVTP